MNNNFMGYFDPMHSNPGMGQEFGRGPPGQQGGFNNMPPMNMNHSGLGMPAYQHQRFMPPYEANQVMGPLSPGVPGMTPGSGIAPSPANRMIDIGRLQHYRASQQSQLQHSPVSLSPMPGMNAISPAMTNQNLYMRMPSLAPKQQIMEPRLQSQLGNGINRWPRMPGTASLSRPQMPQLMMQQGIPVGSMPLLHSNNFQMGNSPGFSSPDMIRFMKMEQEDSFPGTSPSISSFDFGPSPGQTFPPNHNPYNMERPMPPQPPPPPPPSFKQSSGNPIGMPQDPLSMSVGPNVHSQPPQSMPLTPAPPNTKQFNDNFNKFVVNPLPNSPKLTHFGPSPGTADIFDQPNPLSSQQQQQKSPFSPFGDGLGDNLTSSQAMRMPPNMHQTNIPLSASSPMMPTGGSLNMRSPTKINPLMMQIQQLKQQIAQLEENPMNSSSFAQVSFLKQQLEQTYIRFISQQHHNDFPSMKDRQAASLQDFILDKPPMTPRSQTDYSLDKPPPTPIPRQQPMNDFMMEKGPKNDFMLEKGLGNVPPHLQPDFMMIKSPQTPAPPPQAQHDLLLDKPPMTPRPKLPPPSHQEFLLEHNKQQLSMRQQPPNEFSMDRPPPPPHASMPKNLQQQQQQQRFMFEKLQQQQQQQQPALSQQSPASFHLENHQPKTPAALQHENLEKTLASPRQSQEFLMDKLPSSQLGQSQNTFNLVKSPLSTNAPSQMGSLHDLTQQQSGQIALQSPPNLFSQSSQSPLSVTHTISQDSVDADMDIKDDISFLDELFQTKLSDQGVKQNVEMMTLQSSRKEPVVNRSSNSMPVLDGMHTSSTSSSTLPPTMPVLAPSVPPISASGMQQFPPSMPGVGPGPGMAHMNHHGQIQQSIPMPMQMQMPLMSMHYSNPMMMMNNMQEHGGPGPGGMPPNMPHNMYNFGQMPSVRPPSLKPPSLKERTKSAKSSAGSRAASGLAPATKKKKLRRKSSESDTLPSSPKTPMTPATPNSSVFSNVSNINPSSNVSSVNSGENITAINPFMLEDQLADSAATRRSLRERKKKNYNDDYDYNLSDEDEKKKAENPDQQTLLGISGHKLIAYKPSDAVEGEIAIVEKILAGRIKSPVKTADGTIIEEEEYFVKYKGYSYLHCEWGTEKELTIKDKRVPTKIKRFKTKRDPVAILAELDDEPFNPDFVEVDRVLDINMCVDQITGETVTHYLVKWRSLPYEDSTWELKINVDEPKVKQYLELKKPPPAEFQQYVARPQAFQWKKIENRPVYKDGNTLRDYQLEGLNWLTFCWYKRQNCILADEMGLGKTVQGISLLFEIKRYGVRGPFLVIAPLSTIVHWQREFEAWTDINAIVYHGSSPSRLLIQQYEMYYEDEKGEKISGLYKFEAVITTYEMILSDNDMLSKIPWRVVVIDEAHRLKNRNCKLLEGLSNLQFEHRVLLTGTPLQNNVEELFSLLNFLEPTRFPSQAAFLLEFGDLKTEAQVEKLQQILKPMMLRRLKEDVEKNVPPKEETIIEVELTTIQKKFYRAILEKNFTFLTRGLSTASNTPNLMNAMMELRKCCNHPFLISGAEERIVAEYANGAEGFEKITKHFKAMTESSGKMVLIDKLLPKLKAGGHKVLIFSQMVRVLDLLEDYLLCKKYLYERIDGRVRGTLRQAAIDRFCRQDSDRFVFLLCTRAGGLGINLTAADIVIIFDSDWNPQNDLQAQARCHRIGQDKSVKIYRLICRNTYEREMFDKASRKLALDRAVLQNMSVRDSAVVCKDTAMNKDTGPATPGNSATPSTPVSNLDSNTATFSVQLADCSGNQPTMSKKEIEDLLKRGAYGSLMDEDGDAGSKFCEEDIDQILERRTQVIQITGEGKGSTFSKASFVSNTAKIDIDLDDPEFWSKWAQKAAIDVDDLNQENLIIDKPRERKQTKRFGNEDGALEVTDMESEDEGEKASVPDVVRPDVPRPDVIRPDVARPDVGRTSWSRAECFRVEKNLLIYGWGRWHDVLAHENFKTDISEREIEAISRTILVFCLHHFKGDEKIKNFVSNTITKSVTRARIISHEALKEATAAVAAAVAEVTDDKTGLKKPVNKNPVKKLSQQNKPVLIEVGPDWKVVDPDTLIIDAAYRKHLQQHSKRILSRVRLLYCLRHEIIGSEAEKIMMGRPVSDIHLQVPRVGDMMTPLWDADADKSLLVGVFKHGYDKYDLIRKDPALAFLHKFGSTALDTERLPAFDMSPDNANLDRREDDSESAMLKRKRKRRLNEDDDYLSDMDDFDNLPKFDKEDDIESLSLFESPVSSASPSMSADGQSRLQLTDIRWPQPPELNTRLRRLIAGYMKVCEKEQMKLAQAEKEKERRERQAQQVREKQLKRAEMASKWSRREVTDFYRVVTTFGIIYDENTNKFDWSKFRKLAKLEKKDDDRITAYYEEFVAMCRRVCNKSTPEDIETKKGENLEPITDERANRVLHRVRLLQTIRNKVLPHENLDDRLALCEPSSDFPFWWKPGIYDKELIVGVGRHGVGRTDFHLFTDHTLKFKGILDELASDLKKRKNLEKLKNEAQKAQNVLPTESQSDVTQSPNSTASISQTTSAPDTPSSGVNADRQPVATHNNDSKMQASTSEESEQLPNSVSKETAEILSSWPKDKAILNRLEKICQCVLNNAWPKNIRLDSNMSRGHSVATTNQPVAMPSSLDRSELMRQPVTTTTGGQEGPRGEKAEGLLSTEKNFKVTSLDGLKITVKKKRRRRTKEQMAAAQLAHVPPPEHLNLPVNHMEQHMQGMPYNAASVAAAEKTKRGRRKRKGDVNEANVLNNNTSPSADEPPLKIVPHPIQLSSSSETYNADLQMKLNPSIILHVPANMDQRTSRVSSGLTDPSIVVASSAQHRGGDSGDRQLTSPVNTSNGAQQNAMHAKPIGKQQHPSDNIACTTAVAITASEAHSTGHASLMHASQLKGSPISRSSPNVKAEATTGTVPSTAGAGLFRAGDKEPSSLYTTTRKEDMMNVCPNRNPFEGLPKRTGPSDDASGESNIFDVLPRQLYNSSGGRTAEFNASEMSGSLQHHSTTQSRVNSLHGTMKFPNAKSLAATTSPCSNSGGGSSSSSDKSSMPSSFSLPGRYFEGHKASAAIAALAAKLHSQAASKAAAFPAVPRSTPESHGRSKQATIMYTPEMSSSSNRSILPDLPVDSSKHVAVKSSSGNSKVNSNTNKTADVKYSEVNSQHSSMANKATAQITTGRINHSSKATISSLTSLQSLSGLVSSQPPSGTPVKTVQATPVRVSSVVKDANKQAGKQTNHITSTISPTATPISALSSSLSSLQSSVENLKKESLPSSLAASGLSKTSSHSASGSTRNRSPTTASSSGGKAAKPVRNAKGSLAKSVIKRSSPVTLSASVASLSTTTAALKGNVTITAGNHQFLVKLATPMPSSKSPSIYSSSSAVNVSLPHSIISSMQNADTKAGVSEAGKVGSTEATSSPTTSKAAAIRLYQVQSNIAKSERTVKSGSSPSPIASSSSSLTSTKGVTVNASPATIASSSTVQAGNGKRKSPVNTPATCVSVITPLSGLIRVVDAANKQQKGVMPHSSPSSRQPDVTSSTVSSSIITASNASTALPKSTVASSAKARVGSQKTAPSTAAPVKISRATVLQVKGMTSKSNAVLATSVVSASKSAATTTIATGSRMSAAEKINAKLQAASHSVSSAAEVVQHASSRPSVSETTTTAGTTVRTTSPSVTPAAANAGRLKRDAPSTSSMACKQSSKSAKASVITQPPSSPQSMNRNLSIATGAGSSGGSVMDGKQTATNKPLSKPKSSLASPANRHSARALPVSGSSAPSRGGDDSKNVNNAPVASRTRPSTRRNTSLAGLSPGPLKKVASKMTASPTAPAKGTSNSLVTASGAMTQTSVSSQGGKSSTLLSSIDSSSPLSVVDKQKSTATATIASEVASASKTASEKRVDADKTPAVTTVHAATANARTTVIGGESVKSGDEAKASGGEGNVVAAVVVGHDDDDGDSGESARSHDNGNSALSQFNESIVIQTTRPVTSTIDHRPKTQKRSLASIVKDLASKSNAQHSLFQPISSTATPSTAISTNVSPAPTNIATAIATSAASIAVATENAIDVDNTDRGGGIDTEDSKTKSCKVLETCVAAGRDHM
eukprot:gene19257-21185_t